MHDSCCSLSLWPFGASSVKGKKLFLVKIRLKSMENIFPVLRKKALGREVGRQLVGRKNLPLSK